MRPTLFLALFACACAAAAPGEDARVLRSIREEYRTFGHMQALLGWYSGTRGETALGRDAPVGHDPLFQRRALAALSRAQATAKGDEALALEFLRKAVVREMIGQRLARWDEAYGDAEVRATVRLPWREQPVPFRDAELVLGQEPDAARRRQAFAAVNLVRAAVLNPILASREEAAQRAAREAGFSDYVALCEWQRDVNLAELLASGVAYVRATEPLFRATLDRVAREELGVRREALRRADWARLWKAPRLARFFDAPLQLPALRAFLDGVGLDLRTAAGTEVAIDDSLHPLKRPRAFVVAVDPPGDVRLSVKPSGGLDDLWTLFHEAGHALHAANATIEPRELRSGGSAAASEAYGEFFRGVFADPRWLAHYRDFLREQGRAAPGAAELAAIARRTALAEMYFIRRYAFAKIAYELLLHGRPPREIAPALALLPAPAPNDLRELYRQLFSVAAGFELSDEDAGPYRTDVDDGFYAADYARAFVLAGQLHEGMRRRFGADWYQDHRAGDFLRNELFRYGGALDAGEVARRLGFAGVDFAAAAARAGRLVAEADALEKEQ